MEPSADQTMQQPEWPGAFGIFKPSRRTVAFSLWPYLGTLILSGVLGGGGGSDQEFDYVVAVLSVLGFLISLPFTIAATVILLNATKSIKTGFVASLKLAFPFYFRMLGLTIILVIIAAVSLLLLIIPFFIVVPRTVLAPYFLIDRNLGVIDSIKQSWAQTKGHTAKVYGIFGVNILMALLIITIIGIPVSIYLLVAYSAATVLLYNYINTGEVSAPTKKEIETPYPSVGTAV